ncbi:hypothetical protein ACIQMR_22345 [Streptomyces sp. NPDC091376]|uniref:hypothetical protein n=1 Tax=Streptomyces sp. NPDC091376 TaxID=3365994 RepID=UPI0037F7C2DC
MRSVPIALRVVGAAAGFLILAPATGTAHADEGEQLRVTVLNPAIAQPDGKQGEEEQQNQRQDREDQNGKKDPKQDQGSGEVKKDPKQDQGSGEGKKDPKQDQGSGEGKKDPKQDQGSGEGKKDRESQGGDREGQGGDDEDEGDDEGGGEDETSLDDLQDPDPAQTPVAPVRAGGGGAATEPAAAHAAKSADTQGPGTPHTVIGLVLAGVAAVAVAFRSARRRRIGSSDRD